MSIPTFEFTKHWTNPADFPTIETSEEQVRADLQALHDETRDYFNEKLLPDIEQELAAAKVWTEEAVKNAVLGELPDASVTGEKLADAAVGREALAEGAVGQAQLDEAVRVPSPKALCVGSQRYDGSEDVVLSGDGMALDSASADALGLGEGATLNDAFAALAPTLGHAQIQCGSYVGNGKTGSGNPVALTFDFVPKFVMVSQADAGPSLTAADALAQTGALWHEGVSKTLMAYTVGEDAYKIWLRYLREGTTLKLWAERSDGSSLSIADDQMNTAGTTYAYVGIGVKEGA